MMNPSPTSEGLLFSEKLIIDRETGSPSCISIFSAIENPEFPFEAPPFYLFSSLTDAEGSCRMGVIVTNLSSDVDIAEFQVPMTFPSRLSTVIFTLRVTDLIFTEPGRHAISLFVDNDLVTHALLDVIESSN